jgi:hypothetical protein
VNLQSAELSSWPSSFWSSLIVFKSCTDKGQTLKNIGRTVETYPRTQIGDVVSCPETFSITGHVLPMEWIGLQWGGAASLVHTKKSARLYWLLMCHIMTPGKDMGGDVEIGR